MTAWYLVTRVLKVIARVSGLTKSARISRLLPKASVGLERLPASLVGTIKTRNGYYVELGAYDGVRFSNTLALELLFGWTGLLIEPTQENFLKLQKRRSQRRNRMVRAACVGSDF